jgi:glycerate 2-kinase
MRSDSRLSLETGAPEVKLGRKRARWSADSRECRELLIIAQEVLHAVRADRLVWETVSRGEGDALRFQLPGSEHSVAIGFRQLVPVAVGKAAPWMGSAFSRVTGETWGGIGVCSQGTSYSCSGWVWLHGDHPTPRSRSLSAGRLMVSRISSASSEDLVVLLLSGGASSLAMAPKRGVSETALASVIEGLLHEGASIHQLNAVRRRLDLLKGGGFARLAAPARVVSLILSDVPGNLLPDIGSGPTSGPYRDEPDPWAVLAGANLLSVSTPRLEQLLRATDETWPFPRPMNLVIGSNETALNAAAEAARRLGYLPVLRPESLTGEARAMGKSLAELVRRLWPVNKRTCLLMGGETVVTVHGRGEGGRNLELALSFALESLPMDGLSIMALATDGKDGSSPAAGAVITKDIVCNNPVFQVGAEKALQKNDTYPYLARMNATLYTGPTGTNVADIVCILMDPP